jgi:hypothetical protein
MAMDVIYYYYNIIIPWGVLGCLLVLKFLQVIIIIIIIIMP